MALPGKPARPMGAEGQIDVPAPFEAPESASDGVENGDDRVNAPVGAQEHGPNSPTHGAAGGLDVNFGEVAPIRFSPEPSTSSTAEKLAVDLGHHL